MFIIGMRIKWRNVPGTDVHLSEQPYMKKVNGKLYSTYKIKRVGGAVWATFEINDKEFYVPYINPSSNLGRHRDDSNFYRTLAAAQKAFPETY